MRHTLEQYGWDSWFDERFATFRDLGLVPARVAVEHRSKYELYSATGPLAAVLAGKLRYTAGTPVDRPCVGDWVAAAPRPEGEATIHGVVSRKSAFTRRASSGGRDAGSQVVAANIDIAFVVTSCNLEFSARRLERYLVAAHDSGAAAVVVLTKADLPGNRPEAIAAEARAVAGASPVVLTSAVTGQGIEDIRAMLSGSRTGALMGSSGVGKSTLINTLVGNTRIATAPVRTTDDRGIHTTTRRELVLLPGGGLLIDTPGMRQIQPEADDAEVLDTFVDVRELATGCKFADCRHEAETGCAVLAAIAEGALDPERLEGYRKLALRRPAWEKRAEEIRISRERSRLKKRGPKR